MEVNRVNKIGMPNGQAMAEKQEIDTVSKNIQDKISSVQQQRRELSSKEGIPDEEKRQKRKELQQELNNLNVQLRQRKAEMRKEKQRKAESETEAKDKMAENTKTKDAKTADTENKAADIKAVGIKGKEADNTENNNIKTKVVEAKDTDKKIKDNENKNNDIKPAEAKTKAVETKGSGISPKKMDGIIGADFDMKKAQGQRIVIARMEEGVVILKGEIKQDEIRGMDTEKKQEELKKQEKRVQDAYSFEFPDSSMPGNPIKNAKVANAAKKENSSSNVIDASDFSKELVM